MYIHIAMFLCSILYAFIDSCMVVFGSKDLTDQCLIFAGSHSVDI